MVHWQKATIRAKLTRQMLVVGVVPVLVLGGVAYLTMSRALDLFGRGLDSSAQAMERHVVGANLRRDAENVTARIDTYIEERVKDVVIWASDPLVIEAAVRANALARARGWPGYPEILRDQATIDRIEDEMKATRTLNPVPAATQYLKDQLAQSKAFKEVFFTDRNGYNAAISNMTSDFVQSDEEWWVTAWMEGIDIGGTSRNPLTTKKPETTGARVTYDKSAEVWSIAISVRIDHLRTKKPLGVMKAVLDISAVQALTSRAAGEIPGGDVKVLVATTGDLIADTSVKHDRKFIMSKDGNLLSAHFKPAEVISQKDGPRSGYLIGRSDAHGTAQPVDQVIGFAKSGGKGEFKDVPGFEGLGWATVVGQEKQLAFAALDDLTRVQGALVGQRRWLQATILSVVVLAAAGIFGLGAVLGRRIASPIQELSAAATRVSGGDLSVRVRVAVASNDEIGQLGGAFNEMTMKLSHAHTELEGKNMELAGALQNLQESRQRLELLEQLKGELSKFVPESVKKLLEQNPNASELEKKHVEVSVLFLDIAGYTKLSEQLEAKKLNQLVQTYFSSFLEIIQNHHGDINETAGDGLMVIFQSERTTTDHALNATRAAFAIRQRTMTLNEDYGGVFPSVQLHMGINTGEAWVGATKLASAGGQRWTFTATGPTTNVAARLAGSAQGNEIVVGPTTAERMKAYFVLESLGEREFKNVSAPIHVYRVIPPGVYEKIV